MISWRKIWHSLFLPPGNSALGICSIDGVFKTAAVSKIKGQLHFLGCTTHERPTPHARIASGLDVQEVVHRNLILPVKGDRKVLAALPFQLETLLPFPMDRTIVCTFLKTLSPQSTAVSVIATSADKLKSHLNNLAESEIYPDVVTCTPSALFRIAQWVCPQQKNVLIFHFGDHKTSCALVQDREIVLFQSLKIGRNDFVKALSAAFPEKNHEELELLIPTEPVISVQTTLRHELERLSVYIRDKVKMSEDTPWILLGQTPHGIESLWASIFSDLQLLPTLPQDLTLSLLNSHCIPLGFAIDALETDGRSVQFCQKELTPSHHLVARKKRALTYTASCVILSLILGICSTVIVQKKKAAMSEKFLSYLPSLQEKYQTLSQDDMEQELLKWEQSLLKQKNSFSFFLTAPKVSEVLAWLSTHPSLVDAQGSLREGIDIKGIHYQLTKYPTLEEPSALYQAQVEIEFTSTTPRLAREFHEILLKGDRIVNAKKEMKWNAHGNVYSIQFELNKVSPS